ncbi:hypothetical protein [Mycolicibacterium peregrinum]|uniref:Uncharacterized protein n=1 Tax=Mycolicibacterium peregrinum TaxID=43304 RepID=A0A4Z0HTY7_MYCPR|nr:hypothetical protein [Mycolicibacterium peregrinum]TGB41447.1 hypothetical protein EJD98_16140 [Mycolicibacterium peregrinum]TGB41829.1 hypothetical protein EJD94_15690 [Mycolicibacterium peregrinum]
MSGRSVMQSLGEDWVVVMEWPEGVDNGGPCRLEIKPVGGCPVGGLSSTVLRQIDFRGAVANMREQLGAAAQRNAEHEAVEKWRTDRLKTALTSGVTDDYLVLLSDAYLSIVNRGGINPNDYLAKMAGKSTSTVRGHLWQARKRGFLTGSPGRKGGQLTTEAATILERLDEQAADSFFDALEQVRTTRAIPGRAK